jgi:hypothetical protein
MRRDDGEVGRIAVGRKKPKLLHLSPQMAYYD